MKGLCLKLPPQESFFVCRYLGLLGCIITSLMNNNKIEEYP